MIFEKFQNNLGSQNESLDSAYSGESLNIIGNSSNLDLGGNAVADAAADNTGSNGSVPDDFHQHIELEDAKFDFNIWDLLGVSSLSKDKRNCMLDCGIKSLHCILLFTLSLSFFVICIFVFGSKIWVPPGIGQF